MKYLLGIALFISPAAFGQYSLALHLQTGQAYFLNIQSNLQATATVDGRKMLVRSVMNGLARFTVKTATDSTYELEGSYDSVTMTIRTPMGVMDWHAGDQVAKSMGEDETLGQMAKKHFSVILRKNGSVKKIVGADSLSFGKMMKQFPAMENIRRLMMMGHFKNHFDAAALQRNLALLTAIFPDKKVALNDTWGNTIQADSGMDHRITTSYRLLAYTGGVATIQGEMVSAVKSRAGSRFPAAYDLNGKTASTFRVDANTGWIRDGELHNELNGQIQLKDSANTSKTIPLQLTATTKLIGTGTPGLK